jgi:soluble lytic murein transglycosylase
VKFLQLTHLISKPILTWTDALGLKKYKERGKFLSLKIFSRRDASVPFRMGFGIILVLGITCYLCMSCACLHATAAVDTAKPRGKNIHNKKQTSKSIPLNKPVIQNITKQEVYNFGDDPNIAAAISFAMKDDLASAVAAAERSGDPEFAKAAVEVLRIYNNPSKIALTKLKAFLKTHNWVPEEIFIPKIESSINYATNHDELVQWFDYKPPRTNRGKFFLLNANIRLRKADISKEEIRSKLRSLWRSTEFDSSTEEKIISEYKDVFTVDDLLKKIDFLIWNNNPAFAQKLATFLPSKYRPLAISKLEVAKHPERAYKYWGSNDEFIKYIHLRNLSKTKVDKNFIKSLESIKPKGNYEKWWKLKNIGFREALNNKDFQAAYNLTQYHGLETGAAFADAEWYGGWIALEFLKNPDKAIAHFLPMYENTKLANSKSKAAYWLARAYFAAKNLEKATFWYKKASMYTSTFYGQLSLAESRGGVRYNYFDGNQELNKSLSTQADKDKTKKIVLLAYYLFKANYKMLAYNIIDHIPKLHLGRVDLEAAAFFFNKRDLRPLAVELGKSSANRSFILIKEAYPSNVKITNTILPKALYLAVIRQESNFDPLAFSSAGARGLMQLMPKTASVLASKLGLPKNAYAYDPNANILKGSTYLDQLYSQYGNMILTIAAYNAGPGNVQKWVKLFGDPRKMSVIQKINWIETIPFSETRNYVKKVLENMVIYDMMLVPSHNTRSIIKFLEL